jgi:hypothetical protein
MLALSLAAGEISRKSKPPIEKRSRKAIRSPIFHGYPLLNAMGDEILSSTDGAIIIRVQKAKHVVALVYNYPSEVTTSLPATSSLAEADAPAAVGVRSKLAWSCPACLRT